MLNYMNPEEIKASQENDEYFKGGILFARQRIEDVFTLCRAVERCCPQHSITLKELEDTLLKVVDPEITDKYFDSLKLATIEEIYNAVL